MKHSTALTAVLLTAASLLWTQPVDSADAPLNPARATAVWKPRGAFDPLEQELQFAEALVDRGLADLANDELAAVPDEALQNASASNRALYGVVAIRALLETSRLATPEDRAAVADALVELRRRLADLKVGKDTANFELQYVRAFYALGILAVESGDAAEGTPYLAVSAYTARAAIEALPNEEAKPFLYWHAKATLARREDVRRFEYAEKVAGALEHSSAITGDEYYFYAKLLLIESARERGDFKLAGQRIAETLEAFGKKANERDAPYEIAVGLLAEETRLLTAEGKQDEAVKIAAQNVDLLGNPLPPDRGRYADKMLDLFADRELARAETFWRAAQNAPEENADANLTNLPNKKALLEAAQLASAGTRSNVWRARAALLAKAAGQATEDWNTLQAAAEADFRNGAWEDALAGYDRAAREASASGAKEDAFRLRAAAAGIVNKICCDKLFDATNEKDPMAWEREARRRFEELARENPNDALAPSFFLVALEHAQNANESDETLNALRLEYLTLFPNASNRGAFALDLARRFVDAEDYASAERALEGVAPDDPLFPYALEFERRIYNARAAQTPSESLFVDTTARLLRKTSAGLSSPPGTLGELSQALADYAQNASANQLAADSQVLALIGELALTDEALKDDALANALGALLDAWEQAVSDDETLGKIRSYRLSLAIETKTPQEIVALLGSFDSSGSAASLDAVERLLDFAERSQSKTQRQLASFALDAAKTLKTSDADRVALVQADALRMLGGDQESLNIYARLHKKDPHNARVLKGLASLLTDQKDAKALELAVKYWTDYADLNAPGSPEWWNGKEKCVEIYCKSGKKEQAEKMLKTLWLTRSDPSDPERKARWEKMIGAAQ